MYRAYLTPRTALKLVLSLAILALFAPPLRAQRFVKVVDTVEQLARLNPNDVHTNVFVADPLRGGLFTLATRTSTNNGTAFASTNALKQWNRQYEGYLNAKWFGAVGDGSTDDTVALTNLLFNLPAYGTMLIPEGTYKITDNLNIPRGDVRIINRGKIVQHTAGKGVFGNWNTSTDTIYRVHIIGGTYATAANVVGTNAFYLRNMGQAYIHFDNITTEGSGASSGFFYPIHVFGDTYPNGSYYTHVKGEAIFGYQGSADAWGIFTDANGTNNGPNNCTFEVASIQMGAGNGVLLNYSTCAEVHRTAVENSHTGFRIRSLYPLKNNVIENCRGEDNIVDAVFTAGTTNNVARGNDWNSSTRLQDFGYNKRDEDPELEMNNGEFHSFFLYSTGGNEDKALMIGTDPGVLGGTNEFGRADTRHWEIIARAVITNDLGQVVYNLSLTNPTFSGDLHFDITTNNRVFIQNWNINPVGFHFATNHIMNFGVDPTRYFNFEYRMYETNRDGYAFAIQNTNYNSWVELSNVWNQGSSYNLISNVWLRYGGGGITDGQFLKRVDTNITSALIEISDVSGLQSELDGKQDTFTTGDGVTNIANVLSGTYQAGTNIVFVTNSTGVQINSSAASTDTDGYTLLPIVTTTDATETPIFTNTVPAGSMSTIDADIQILEDAFGGAKQYKIQFSAIRDAGANIVTEIKSFPVDAALATYENLTVDTLGVTGSPNHVVTVQNNTGSGTYKWRMRYKVQTLTY